MSVICIVMVPEINMINLLSRVHFIRAGQAFRSAPPPPVNLSVGTSCQCCGDVNNASVEIICQHRFPSNQIRFHPDEWQ